MRILNCTIDREREMIAMSSNIPLTTLILKNRTLSGAPITVSSDGSANYEELELAKYKTSKTYLSVAPLRRTCESKTFIGSVMTGVDLLTAFVSQNYGEEAAAKIRKAQTTNLPTEEAVFEEYEVVDESTTPYGDIKFPYWYDPTEEFDLEALVPSINPNTGVEEDWHPVKYPIMSKKRVARAKDAELVIANSFEGMKDEEIFTGAFEGHNSVRKTRQRTSVPFTRKVNKKRNVRSHGIVYTCDQHVYDTLDTPQNQDKPYWNPVAERIQRTRELRQSRYGVGPFYRAAVCEDCLLQDGGEAQELNMKRLHDIHNCKEEEGIRARLSCFNAVAAHLTHPLHLAGVIPHEDYASGLLYRACRGEICPHAKRQLHRIAMRVKLAKPGSFGWRTQADIYAQLKTLFTAFEIQHGEDAGIPMSGAECALVRIARDVHNIELDDLPRSNFYNEYIQHVHTDDERYSYENAGDCLGLKRFIQFCALVEQDITFLFIDQHWEMGVFGDMMADRGIGIRQSECGNMEVFPVRVAQYIAMQKKAPYITTNDLEALNHFETKYFYNWKDKPVRPLDAKLFVRTNFDDDDFFSDRSSTSSGRASDVDSDFQSSAASLVLENLEKTLSDTVGVKICALLATQLIGLATSAVTLFTTSETQTKWLAAGSCLALLISVAHTIWETVQDMKFVSKLAFSKISTTLKKAFTHFVPGLEDPTGGDQGIPQSASVVKGIVGLTSILAAVVGIATGSTKVDKVFTAIRNAKVTTDATTTLSDTFCEIFGIDHDGTAELAQTVAQHQEKLLGYLAVPVADWYGGALKERVTFAEEMRKFITAVRQKKATVAGLNHLVSHLTQLEAKITALRLANNNRRNMPVPAACHLWGDGGHGKTEVMTRVIPTKLSKMIKGFNPGALGIPPSTDHAPIYQNEHTVYYDEVGANINTTTGNKGTIFSTLNTLVSGGAVLSPSAQIEGKDQVIRARLVISASNIALSEMDMGLNDPAKRAFFSRTLSFKVVDPNFDPSVERNKQTGRKTDFSHLRFYPTTYKFPDTPVTGSLAIRDEPMDTDSDGFGFQRDFRNRRRQPAKQPAKRTKVVEAEPTCTVGPHSYSLQEVCEILADAVMTNQKNFNALQAVDFDGQPYIFEGKAAELTLERREEQQEETDDPDQGEMMSATGDTCSVIVVSGPPASGKTKIVTDPLLKMAKDQGYEIHEHRKMEKALENEAKGCKVLHVFDDVVDLETKQGQTDLSKFLSDHAPNTKVLIVTNFGPARSWLQRLTGRTVSYKEVPCYVPGLWRRLDFEGKVNNREALLVVKDESQMADNGKQPVSLSDMLVFWAADTAGAHDMARLSKLPTPLPFSSADADVWLTTDNEKPAWQEFVTAFSARMYVNIEKWAAIYRHAEGTGDYGQAVREVLATLRKRNIKPKVYVRIADKIYFCDGASYFVGESDVKWKLARRGNGFSYVFQDSEVPVTAELVRDVRMEDFDTSRTGTAMEHEVYSQMLTDRRDNSTNWANISKQFPMETADYLSMTKRRAKSLAKRFKDWMNNHPWVKIAFFCGLALFGFYSGYRAIRGWTNQGPLDPDYKSPGLCHMCFSDSVYLPSPSCPGSPCYIDGGVPMKGKGAKARRIGGFSFKGKKYKVSDVEDDAASSYAGRALHNARYHILKNGITQGQGSFKIPGIDGIEHHVSYHTGDGGRMYLEIDGDGGVPASGAAFKENVVRIEAAESGAYLYGLLINDSVIRFQTHVLNGCEDRTINIPSLGCTATPIYTEEDRDITYAILTKDDKVYHAPKVRDIADRFLSTMDLHRINYVTVYSTDFMQSHTTPFYYEATMQHPIYNISQKIVTEAGHTVWGAVPTPFLVQGSCGSLAVASMDNKAYIVGTYANRRHNRNQEIFVVPTLEEYERFCTYVKQDEPCAAVPGVTCMNTTGREVQTDEAILEAMMPVEKADYQVSGDMTTLCAIANQLPVDQRARKNLIADGAFVPVFGMRKTPVRDMEEMEADPTVEIIPDDAGNRHIYHNRLSTIANRHTETPAGEHLRKTFIDAAEQMGQHYRLQLPAVKPYTIDEAVWGGNGSEPMKRDTATGGAFQIIFPGISKKDQIFGDKRGEWLGDAGQFVKENATLQWTSWAKREDYCIPGTGSMKAENLPPEKHFRKRIVNVCDPITVINQKRLLAPLQAAFQTLGADSPIQITMNPYTDTHPLAMRIINRQNMYDFDMKNYDMTVPKVVIDATAHFMKVLYGAGPTLENIIDMMALNSCETPLIMGNSMVSRKYGIMSGMGNTSFWDSVHGMIMTYVACQSTMKGPYSYVQHRIDTTEYHGGDDGIFATDSIVTGEDIANFFKDHLDMTVTASKKDQSLSEPIPIEEVSYCSRTFVDIGGGYWCGRLKEEAISSMLCWTSSEDDEEIMEQVLNALKELTMYPQEKYDQLARLIYKRWPTANIVSHASAREQLRNEIINVSAKQHFDRIQIRSVSLNPAHRPKPSKVTISKKLIEKIVPISLMDASKATSELKVEVLKCSSLGNIAAHPAAKWLRCNPVPPTSAVIPPLPTPEYWKVVAQCTVTKHLPKEWRDYKDNPENQRLARTGTRRGTQVKRRIEDIEYLHLACTGDVFPLQDAITDNLTDGGQPNGGGRVEPENLERNAGPLGQLAELVERFWTLQRDPVSVTVAPPPAPPKPADLRPAKPQERPTPGLRAEDRRPVPAPRNKPTFVEPAVFREPLDPNVVFPPRSEPFVDQRPEDDQLQSINPVGGLVDHRTPSNDAASRPIDIEKIIGQLFPGMKQTHFRHYYPIIKASLTDAARIWRNTPKAQNMRVEPFEHSLFSILAISDEPCSGRAEGTASSSMKEDKQRTTPTATVVGDGAIGGVVNDDLVTQVVSAAESPIPGPGTAPVGASLVAPQGGVGPELAHQIGTANNLLSVANSKIFDHTITIKMDTAAGFVIAEWPVDPWGPNMTNWAQRDWANHHNAFSGMMRIYLDLYTNNYIQGALKVYVVPHIYNKVARTQQALDQFKAAEIMLNEPGSAILDVPLTTGADAKTGIFYDDVPSEGYGSVVIMCSSKIMNAYGTTKSEPQLRVSFGLAEGSYYYLAKQSTEIDKSTAFVPSFEDVTLAIDGEYTEGVDYLNFDRTTSSTYWHEPAGASGFQPAIMGLLTMKKHPTEGMVPGDATMCAMSGNYLIDVVSNKNSYGDRFKRSMTLATATNRVMWPEYDNFRTMIRNTPIDQKISYSSGLGEVMCLPVSAPLFGTRLNFMNFISYGAADTTTDNRPQFIPGTRLVPDADGGPIVNNEHYFGEFKSKDDLTAAFPAAEVAVYEWGDEGLKPHVKLDRAKVHTAIGTKKDTERIPNGFFAVKLRSYDVILPSVALGETGQSVLPGKKHAKFMHEACKALNNNPGNKSIVITLNDVGGNPIAELVANFKGLFVRSTGLENYMASKTTLNGFTSITYFSKSEWPTVATCDASAFASRKLTTRYSLAKVGDSTVTNYVAADDYRDILATGARFTDDDGQPMAGGLAALGSSAMSGGSNLLSSAMGGIFGMINNNRNNDTTMFGIHKQVEMHNKGLEVHESENKKARDFTQTVLDQQKAHEIQLQRHENAIELSQLNARLHEAIPPQDRLTP